MQSGNRWLGPFSVSNLPEYVTGAYDRNPAGFADNLTIFACYHEVEMIHACCAMLSNSNLVHAQSLLAIRRYQVVLMAAVATCHEDGVPWLVQIDDFCDDGSCDLPDRFDDLVDHDIWDEDLDDFTPG